MPANLATTLNGWSDAALSFLYPEVCQYCHGARATWLEGYICSDCSRHVHFVVPPRCERCGLPFHGAVTDTFECANCREMDLHFSYARSSVAAKGMVLEL